MSSPDTEVGDRLRPGVVAKLSTLDRWLPVWILAAMAVGLLASRLIPGLGEALGAVVIDGVSLPIALGLPVMMYPVLAKVRYDRLDTVTGDRWLLVSSLVLNWLIGPALMFGAPQERLGAVREKSRGPRGSCEPEKVGVLNGPWPAVQRAPGLCPRRVNLRPSSRPQ